MMEKQKNSTSRAGRSCCRIIALPDLFRMVPIAVVSAASLSPVSALGQIDPTCMDSTAIVIPGERYAMGGFGRLFWGDHYRRAWTTAIRVPVLDLQRCAGGLTATELGGGRQTKSLRFRDAVGREYSFRSIDKNPAAALPPLLRTTIAADVLQDQISAQHPAGALVCSPILETAGVLHAAPLLVVMPDDERLGEYREEFANMLGMIEIRPDDYDADVAAFAGADRVIGSETLLDLIREDPADRVNARAFLNARLLDFYLGDWDRHIDQWRWAEFGSDSLPGWYPIPRDRDQVFSKLDGLFPAVAQWSMPQIVGYSDKYLSVFSLHWNSRDIDRRFLSDLERPVWDSIAAGVTSKITDETIEQAVRRLPEELYRVDGAWLESTLKSRRDRLPDAAGKFYELLAHDVEIHATDEAETVQIREIPGGYVEVVVAERLSDAAPYFKRRFDPRETNEVRVHLYGGDDSVAVGGSGGLGLLVRVIGGKGDDTYAFETPTGHVRLYDASGDNQVTGDPPGGTSINGKDYGRKPQAAPRDWGYAIVPTGYIAYGTDYGVLLKVGISRRQFGFRRDPYASKWTLSAAVATRKRYDLSIEHDYRFENSGQHIHTRAFGTSFDVIHFYGLGNNSTSDSGTADFYEVERRLLTFEPIFARSFGKNLDVGVGPVARYSRTGANEGKFISTVPDLYGAAGFGQIGLGINAVLNTREGMSLDSVEQLDDLTGVSFEAAGWLYPAAWDVESTYGTLSVLGRAYLPTGVPNTMLAVRAGGKKVWGEYPWFDAAFVGGEESLRGWRVQRFAGDASLYGSAELRAYVTSFRLLVPQLFGVYGLFDVGRVWVDGQSPGGWHTGYGGGIWLGFLGARYLLSASFVASKDASGLYIGWGFDF
jgi:hypothetical protein